MKKIITLIFVAAGFLLQAQLGATDTYLNNQFWFSIAQHDSIVEDYTDSTGALNGDIMQTVDYHRLGLIDTLAYSYGGMSIDGYMKSIVNANTITVYEMQMAFGGIVDSISYSVFHQGANGKDTLIEGYYYDSTVFNKEEQYHLTYDAQGILSVLRIKADDGSGTLIEVGKIETFRSAGRIDSAFLSYDIAGTNFIVQKIFNTYNGAKQTRFEVFSLEDPTTISYIPSYEYLFSHNSNDEIVEAVAFEYDANGARSFDVRQAFLKRSGSTIGVDERTLPQVQVYPNPAQAQLRVAGKTAFAYSVVNTLGAVVAQGNSVDGTINIESLAAGVYQLQVQADELYQTSFVKQ